jgi:hypothetical protein
VSDETYFLIAILIGTILFIVSTYQLLSRRYKSSKKRPKGKIDQLAPTQAGSKFECDIVNNPAFSDMKINIFHQNHCGDDN